MKTNFTLNRFFTIFSMATLLLAFLTACSSNSPESVAKEFAQAYYAGKFDKAKKYCTPETQEGIQFISKMAESDDFKKNIPSKVSIKTDGCTIADNGNEATVRLTVDMVTPTDGKKTESTKINLVKYDGKWMVLFKAK